MVKKITQNEFDKVLQSKLAVVDFSATWCGPCKMLAPLLDEVAGEMSGQMDFFNVDVDESQALAAQFQIQGVPTMIVMKDGKPVDMQVGFLPKDQLQAFIKKQL